MLLNNIRIATKGMIPVIVMTAFTLFVAGFGSQSAMWIHSGNKAALDINEKSTLANGSLALVVGIGSMEFRAFSDPSEATFRDVRDTIEKNVSRVNESLQKLNNPVLPPPSGEAEKLSEIGRLWTQYVQSLNTTRQKVDRYLANWAAFDQAARQDLLAEAVASRLVSKNLETVIEAYADSVLKRANDISAVGDTFANNVSFNLWLIASLSILLAGLIAYLVAKFGIIKPINTTVHELQTLADGHLEIDIQGIERRDEVGEISKTMVVFKENGLRIRQIQEEQETIKKQAEIDKRRAMNELADNFDASVRKIVETVSSAATEMQASSATLTDISHQTLQQAQGASLSSEQSNVNVQTVAAATEELSSSISEIAHQVATSSQVAKTAVEQAKKTDVLVQGLAESAQKIGEVVSLINDIASQTNLLALNATIEAARAGDAGKGFAVVASEVKNLANQTARATEEIGGQIAAVQQATTNSEEAIREIAVIIGRINEVTGSIAAAAEEQSAATQEIARNVQEASSGVQEVSSNITQVNRVSAEAGQAAAQVSQSAKELAHQAELLMSEVISFITQIRNS